MIEPDYKHVLFKDLHDYIRKDQYMSGFTAVEQAWIRKNIGAVSEQDAVRTSFEVSYEDLRKLIVQKNLNPGSVYIINNFQTIYSSNRNSWYSSYLGAGYQIMMIFFLVGLIQNSLLSHLIQIQ